MRAFIEFIRSIEIWFYIVIGVVALLYSQKLFAALDAVRLATFRLERETAVRQLRTSILTLMGLLGLAGVIFISITFISPLIPWDGSLPTPTLDLLAVPTMTMEPTEELVLFPSEITPTPPMDGNYCVEGILEWTFPVDGEEISGIIEARGSVNFPALGFYKYEYSQQGSDLWITISAGSQQVVDEKLGGAWNTTTVPSGNYQLRIVATDNDNNYLPPCTINIVISN
jgi:hypothetical protein